MNKAYRIFCSIIFLGLFSSTSAFGQSLILPKKNLIFPQNPMEISKFKSEFCEETSDRAKNNGASSPSALCAGKMQFKGSVTVRAIAVKNNEGQFQIFIENDIPAVELLKPEFTVLGPLNTQAQGMMTTGSTQLSFDFNGNINGIAVDLYPWGLVFTKSFDQ